MYMSFSYDLLDQLWNAEIERIRSSRPLKQWLAGTRSANTANYSSKLEDGTPVAAETLEGKQLRITLLIREDADPKANLEACPSLTRNLPHDLQRIMKGGVHHRSR